MEKEKTERNSEEKLAGAKRMKVRKGESNIKLRGKVFQGIVVSKNTKRVAINLERMVYVKKYERYKKLRTKIHARLPDAMADEINLGDYIRVQECRPLSKIIHFMVVSKIKDTEKEVIVKKRSKTHKKKVKKKK